MIKVSVEVVEEDPSQGSRMAEGRIIVVDGMKQASGGRVCGWCGSNHLMIISHLSQDVNISIEKRASIKYS